MVAVDELMEKEMENIVVFEGSVEVLEPGDTVRVGAGEIISEELDSVDSIYSR